MPLPVILCVDDDPFYLSTIKQELAPFERHFELMIADNREQVNQILNMLSVNQQRVALMICNHLADDTNGIELLINVDKHPASIGARTLLIDETPNLEVILKAVNEGRLNHYLLKPWQQGELTNVAKKELTSFVIRYDCENLLNYCDLLDQTKLVQTYIDNQIARYHQDFIHPALQFSDSQLAEKLIASFQEYIQRYNQQQLCETYPDGHILTHEGKPNSFLWLIVTGEVRLFKRDENGQSHQVAQLGQGSLIGGMSFVTDDLSFSTSITSTPTQVLKLDRHIFSDIMQQQSTLLPLFINYLLRHFNRRLKNNITTEVKLQQTLQSLEMAHHQLIEKEKMAMLGQLVAGVAHELNNPVSAIIRNSDNLAQHVEHIIYHPPQDLCLQQKAAQVLNQAQQCHPLSTQAVRDKAKQLVGLLGSKQLARDAVTLGLDTPEHIRALLAECGKDAETAFQALDHYHQIGSLLRATHVCAVRIAELVKSLKSYARQDDEILRIVDIHEGIEDTLLMFENQLKRIQIVRDYSQLTPVTCLANALQQVWTNLIANALDATKHKDTKGKIKITTAQTSLHGEPAVRVQIEDNGTGIAVDNQAKIFELNYTTKRDDHFGLGIGLSICRQIVERHGGRIDVDSAPNQFTVMTIILPNHPLHAVI